MAEKDWDALVASARTIPYSRKLKRCVAQLAWNKSRKYLFTSGKRNRCNPKGVLCIYMSENRATALAEWDKYNAGNDHPFVVYTGSLKAGALIDFGDPKTREHFGLGDDDFFTPWRTRGKTNLQELGAAISRQKTKPGQTLVAGMRFPSDAQHQKGKDGYNVVLYKKAVLGPDSLRVENPEGGDPLDDWPEKG